MNIIRQIDILESCWMKSGSDVLKAVSLLLFIFLSFFFLWKLNSFSASYYRNSSLRNCSDILENYLMRNWDNFGMCWYVHSDFFSEASSGLKTRQKKRQLTLFPVPLLLFLCQLFHEGHHVRLFRSHHLPDDQNHIWHRITEMIGWGNTLQHKTLQ